MAGHTTPHCPPCVAQVILSQERGCPVDAKDARGYTALMYACENNHSALLDQLLKVCAVAALAAVNSCSLTRFLPPQHHASVLALTPAPSKFFEGELEFQEGSESVLHLSAKHGHWQILSRLLGATIVDIEAVDAAGTRTRETACLVKRLA